MNRPLAEREFGEDSVMPLKIITPSSLHRAYRAEGYNDKPQVR